jgi:hypothetical protein
MVKLRCIDGPTLDLPPTFTWSELFTLNSGSRKYAKSQVFLFSSPFLTNSAKSSKTYAIDLIAPFGLYGTEINATIIFIETFPFQ